MIGLVTAIYAGYDELRPLPAQSIEVDAVCVTDDPDLAADGWRTLVVPAEGLHPNRAAKLPKMLPWEYAATGVGPGTGSVWIDASYEVVEETFVEDVLPYADPIAQFRHPWRDCIYDEATASIHPKYAGEPIERQVRSYRTEHPAHWGLWAAGVIVRKHTAAVVEFGYDWLDEVERWSFQDQVSEPVALRRAGLRPRDLPGDHLSNPWLVYRGSDRH